MSASKSDLLQRKNEQKTQNKVKFTALDLAPGLPQGCPDRVIFLVYNVHLCESLDLLKPASAERA